MTYRKRKCETDDIARELPAAAARALFEAHIVCEIECAPELREYLDRYVLKSEQDHADACVLLACLLVDEDRDADAYELLCARIDYYEDQEGW